MYGSFFPSKVASPLFSYSIQKRPEPQICPKFVPAIVFEGSSPGGLEFVKNCQNLKNGNFRTNFDKVFDKFQSPRLEPSKTIGATNFGQIWGSRHFECCKGKRVRKSKDEITSFSLSCPPYRNRKRYSSFIRAEVSSANKLERKQKGGFVQGRFWRMCPHSGFCTLVSFLYPRSGFWGPGTRFLYPRSGFGSPGTSAKTTLLETTLLRTPDNKPKADA